jgi:cytochrome P450
MTVAQAARLTIIYDHHGADYARDYDSIARGLLAEKPVAWSDTYDGFWVISRYEDVKHIADNWQLFSSENRAHEGDMTRRGIVVPPLPFPPPLNESDPPVHTKRRMIEAPYFTPKHLRRWQEAAKQFTSIAIDDVIETGEVEFVRDICLRIPAMTTLHVGGVDPQDWDLYAHPDKYFEGDQAAIYGQVIDRLVALLIERQGDPRDDIATALARVTVQGEEPMDLRVAAGMLHTIVTGGFDTAMSLLGNALEWMERNGEARAHLRANPQAMENAVEEFLRNFPPVHHIARNVVEDIELSGQHLKAGDRVLMQFYAANHDPDKFEDPWEIRLDRPNARDHMAYSGGNHRCLGAPLARVEMRHILNEVLRRMPDYCIDRDRAERFEIFRPVHGWARLPATFTPGPREATA